MESDHLQVVPLHKYPQYLRPCCELINDEWPRSETARMMSLQASCDELPTSLILININQKGLLGHCKLTPIPSMRNSCFVETVVISKSLRGKKLGTFLMKKVEEYCKTILKLEMIHLSTKGQEDFYAKLGYVVCAPVSIYGSSITNNNKGKSSNSTSVPRNNTDKSVAPRENTVPPPPPPPMPQPQNIVKTIKSTKTFMFKYLVR